MPKGRRLDSQYSLTRQSIHVGQMSQAAERVDQDQGSRPRPNLKPIQEVSHKFTRGRVSSTTKIKDPSVPKVARYQGILRKRTTVEGSSRDQDQGPNALAMVTQYKAECHKHTRGEGSLWHTVGRCWRLTSVPSLGPLWLQSTAYR